MSQAQAVLLDHRGILKASGADLRDFLQGIVSNDVTKVSGTRAVWSAFLTPQGKFLHEFFLAAKGEGAANGDGLLLDCEAERLDDLKRRLSVYKLRSKVALADGRADYRVAALLGEDALSALDLPPETGAARALDGGIAFVDPRLPSLGARALLPRGDAEATLERAGFAFSDLAAYDALRLRHGVPDGSRDLEVEKSLLLESGFDELHGIDWDKGCYMGQELTARTKYRALIKKRLVPVEIDGPPVESGTAIMAADRQAGTLRSSSGARGLALIRLEYLDAAATPLTAGDAKVTARKPDWAAF